jgi:5-methyltetrahydrofolate--homocysteine methyltransferase
MQDFKALTKAVVEMEEAKALELTQQYLDEGVDPALIFDAFQKSLEEIGKRFEQEIYFIPELILSGKMMESASEIIKPFMKNAGLEESKKHGKILIATVEGDIHDIGKNIIVMMLGIAGFEVKDMGVDVPTDKIVAETKVYQPDILGLSGLLTLAFDPMKDVVDGLVAEGLRDKTKVIIGGGQMDEGVRELTGADTWVIDAVAGVNHCKEWTK